MAHWVDTYPHDVYASVLLLDGEIYNWKIGQRYWKSPWGMTWRFPLPESMDKFTVETNKWTVNTPKEPEEVFQNHAREWFKQWEVAEGYVGSNPY
ncbi:hypothetical protein [Bacillus proteolyticus]|uniref:hypothetical protein n=1 Tax=Bacillus proteolyticus TaxID=2026192 RepID=UPI003D030737